MRPAMNGLRMSVDKAVSNREQNISKFCAHLDKDIEELGKEVKEIKNIAQVSEYTLFTETPYIFCMYVQYKCVCIHTYTCTYFW